MGAASVVRSQFLFPKLAALQIPENSQEGTSIRVYFY